MSARLEALLDPLFPPRYAGGGQLTTWFCPNWIQAMELIEPRICGRWGLSSADGVCPDSQYYPLTLDGIQGPGCFGGLCRRSSTISSTKGGPLWPLPLAKLLHPRLERKPLPLEVIVPVPLYRRGLGERGHNQAAVLGKELGQLMGTRVEEALIRGTDTIAQVHLSANERLTSIRGAFFSVDRRVSRKKGLLQGPHRRGHAGGLRPRPTRGQLLLHPGLTLSTGETR